MYFYCIRLSERDEQPERTVEGEAWEGPKRGSFCLCGVWGASLSQRVDGFPDPEALGTPLCRVFTGLLPGTTVGSLAPREPLQKKLLIFLH